MKEFGAAYDPDWCGEEGEVDTAQVLVDPLDDDGGVVLHADAHADHTKVHQDEGIEAPVDEDSAKVFPGPSWCMIHAGQVFIVDSCVFTGQDWWGLR